MPKLIEIPSFSDERGTLSVIEKVLPFSINRVYYIYNVNDHPRAGHRHHTGEQALICLHGCSNVHVKTESGHQDFELSSPHQCLLLDAKDWHSIQFKVGSILLVLASHHYSPENYIND